MAGFTEIALSEGMQRVYAGVADKINLTAHPEFLARPIKVLDICGGVGVVGGLLQKQCQDMLGELTPSDFAELVDYVNVDIDPEVLTHSPGRTRWMSSDYVFENFRTEVPFDYVLGLNQNPLAPQYSAQQLDRMGLKDEFMGNPIRMNLMNATSVVRGLSITAALIGTAMLLRKGGLYLWSGFIGEDSFTATSRILEKFGLGLRIVSDEYIQLDENTLDSFVACDTGKKKGKQFDRTKEEYRKIYRLVTMQAKGVSSEASAQAVLAETIKKISERANDCELQERFWG